MDDYTPAQLEWFRSITRLRDPEAYMEEIEGTSLLKIIHTVTTKDPDNGGYEDEYAMVVNPEGKIVYDGPAENAKPWHRERS
jgi:hypothetical protein